MARIRPVGDDYKALRALWVRTFGDNVEDVDDFFKAWGDQVEGYVLENDAGEIASALTIFCMGELVIPPGCVVTSRVGAASAEIRKPAYISYAICTDPAARGNGYGSQITEYARDLALSRGAVSLLCPAEPSLVRFYQPLAYEPRFYATASLLDCTAVHMTSAQISRISAAEYGCLRESLLADAVHIELSPAAIDYIASYHSFYSLEDERIIVAHEKGSSRFAEVLADASLEARRLEDALQILAEGLGIEELSYRTPGNDYLQTGQLGKQYVQAMIASDGDLNFSNGYFGFPFD